MGSPKLHFPLQDVQCCLRIVRILEQLDILRRHDALAYQGIEIDDLLPECRPVQDDADLPIDFLGLPKCQDFKELVQRSEPAGKHHDRSCQVCKPELAHEEIVELECEILAQVWIGPLLEWQSDVEADGSAAGVDCSTVGRFHDPATSAGANDESAVFRKLCFRPAREVCGKLPRVLVVDSQRPGLLDACRPKENYRAVHSRTPKRPEGRQVLRKYPDGPRLIAIEE